MKYSRRNFLKTMSFCVPVLVPSSVLGRTCISPNNRINLGHIGVGGRGTSLLKSFLMLKNTQSVAVCDAFKDRCIDRASIIDQHYSEEFNDPLYKCCRVFSDFRDLLAQKDIDAVVIATPDHWHVPIAIAAVKAGKDVYVEKPLGVSISDNQKLRKIVHKYGAIFQHGTQQRSFYDFRFVCELVRNGYIGDLHTIYTWCAAMDSQASAFNAPGGSMVPVSVPTGFDYDMWLGPAPKTPYTIDRCTNFGTYHHYDNSLGFIAGWGAHPLDIAQWGNNTDNTAPVYYEGKGTIAEQGLFRTVDTWDFWCTYANGVRMRFINEKQALPVVQKEFKQARDHGTMFVGSEGWVAVDRSHAYASPAFLLNIKLKKDDIKLSSSLNHYQNFIDCVKSRRQPVSPIHSAVQSDIISHLCDISVRVCRPIQWDPLNEKILNDPEADRFMSRPYRNPWHR